MFCLVATAKLVHVGGQTGCTIQNLAQNLTVCILSILSPSPFCRPLAAGLEFSVWPRAGTD